MSVTASIRRTLTPIHPEGYIFIAGFALFAMLLSWALPPIGWLGWVLTAWCAYFFRDPARATPIRDGLIVSPADGRIDSVGFFVPPPELGLGARPLPRVSIFMNVFDCHVNRTPIAGRITKIAYRPGLFLSADLDKASDDNERNGLVIETPHGAFGVVQIAGLVARRILCLSRRDTNSPPASASASSASAAASMSICRKARAPLSGSARRRLPARPCLRT